MRHQPLILGGREPADPPQWKSPTIAAYGDGTMALSIDDPLLAEFLRGGGQATASGATVTPWTALTNTSVLRAVVLISSAIGMLPVSLMNSETKEKVTNHPLYRVLKREPNNYQSAFDFKTLMQHRVLRRGNAYARVVRGAGLNRGIPVALLPMDPDRVTPIQNPDLTVSYRYNQPGGGSVTFDPLDVLHLRGPLSLDGLRGVSMVDLAKEAIGLALTAERATARLFRNGSFTDGVLQTDGKLSDEAYKRLQSSWGAKHSGADNAGKTALLEEGLEYKAIAPNAKDAQTIETRKLQIEEVARVFGVPRPLLMVDETSWGSGIEALGQFFVTYALQPQFTGWEQACERVLLRDSEKNTLEIKFNPGALLHGSMADQASFFAKALGAGGQRPFMTQNEVRDLLDLPPKPDADDLTNPMTQPAGASAEPDADDKENKDAKPPGSRLRRVA